MGAVWKVQRQNTGVTLEGCHPVRQSLGHTQDGSFRHCSWVTQSLSEVPALLISKPICLGLRCSCHNELSVPVWKWVNRMTPEASEASMCVHACMCAHRCVSEGGQHALYLKGWGAGLSSEGAWLSTQTPVPLPDAVREMLPRACLSRVREREPLHMTRQVQAREGARAGLQGPLGVSGIRQSPKYVGTGARKGGRGWCG